MLFSSTTIATQASSWIDDFRDWSNASNCCYYFKENGTFCPHNLKQYCEPCTYDSSLNDPSEYFTKYMSFFLMDNPDGICAKGGHPSYAGVIINQNFDFFT